MNKKGGMGIMLLVIFLVLLVIELLFCIYTLYTCTLGICVTPNFFGLGKYMALPIKWFFPGKLVDLQNFTNMTR